MANLLIIDDDMEICRFLSGLVETMGHEVSFATTLEEGLKLGLGNPNDLILLDLDFPEGNGLKILPDLINAPSSPEVIIVTGTGSVGGAEIAFKFGAWDYVRKPFDFHEISLPITRALQYRHEKETEKKPVPLKREGIIGNSPAINHCFEAVAKASVTDANVLITGETGTGKELFAKAIHENSRRSSNRFVPVDCGALPETLVESTLFGHEKAAFTGAEKKRAGLFRQAEGGTIYLDEIGDLPLNIQKSLLRSLQERCIRPLGSDQEISVNFRLVAATNRNLEERVKEGLFREDLLFRLQTVKIDLPPLRDRGHDLEKIVLEKIEYLSKQIGNGIKGVSPEFLEILFSHSWPGNIRELINTLEYALALAGTDMVLYPKHLPPEFRAAMLNIDDNKKVASLNTDGKILTWNEYRTKTELEYLQYILKEAKGNRKEATRLSGISQSRLFEMLKKHNLSKSRA